MKKFKYKFDRLLDIRTYQERQKQFEFASVLSKYLKTKNIIDTSNELRTEYLLNSKEHVRSLDLDYLVLRDKARLGLSNRAKSYMNLLKEQKFIVEKEREVLIEASKKKKTLEILKEREFEKYQKEMFKVENEELDEIGSNIYRKNNNIIIKS